MYVETRLIMEALRQVRQCGPNVQQIKGRSRSISSVRVELMSSSARKFKDIERAQSGHRNLLTNNEYR